MPSAGGRNVRGPARQQLLKRQNLALVLRQVAESPNLSRAQIAVHTGLTKATVSTLVDALMAAGLVIEKDPERGLMGRPGSPVGLNNRGPAGLGIEINVDYVSVCVLDLTGTVRWQTTTLADNRLMTPETVLKLAARTADCLCAKAEAAGLEISGLGVGVPGLVDFAGVLHRAPNLRDWEGLAVADLLCEMLGRPLRSLYCDNEANLAALGERWFASRDDLSDFVFVSGEIGVGAGIVIGGELFRGVQGLGGELGHVTVEPSGQACSCGSRGCLETIAGIEALLEASGGSPAETRSDHSAEALLARALADEPATLAALERAGRALGVALGAFLNVLDLPTVVLGGFYALLAPWLTGPVSDELRERVVNYSWSSTEVVVSSLGAEASVQGAAGITLRRIIDDPAGLFEDILTKS
ncbi:MAG: ROK family transcriptional regulator [Acidimicrobiales bacterium]